MMNSDTKVQPDLPEENQGLQEQKEEEDFKDYPYRWIIVILFCLPNMMNGIEWITFSPISSQIEKAYDVSQFTITLTSIVWMFLYIVINFPSNYILSDKGLRVGIFIGIFFTVLGSWVRLLINESFGWAILGQICGGIGQPFILNAPAQIASVWFKPKQRQMATAILALINVIGVGIGFLFPSFVVESSYSPNTRNEVYDLMVYQAIVISACCVPTVLFFREKPPTPPSHAANTEKMNFKESMKILIKDKDFLYLYISFGCILGNFNSIATLINFYLEKFGFSSDDTSYFGAVFIISGLIGSAVITSIVEKSHRYKKVIIVTSIISIIAYSFNMGVLEAENFGLQLFAFFIYGFFATPLIPLCLEFACEITFPVSETISSGLIYKSGQLFGVTMIIISAQGIVLDSKQNVFISMGIGLIIQLIGLIFIGLVNENLKRKGEERRLDEQKQKQIELPQTEQLINQQSNPSSSGQ